MSNNAEKTTIVTEDDDEPDDWLVGLQLALLSELTMGVGISASSALAATVSFLKRSAGSMNHILNSIL